MRVTGVRARLRVEHPEWYCPDCGHLWRIHQNGTPTSTTPRDAPVACYAVVGTIMGPDSRVLADGSLEPIRQEVVGYTPCGCRRLLDDEELALEVLRGQAAQRGEQRP